MFNLEIPALEAYTVGTGETGYMFSLRQEAWLELLFSIEIGFSLHKNLLIGKRMWTNNFRTEEKNILAI